MAVPPLAHTRLTGRATLLAVPVVAVVVLLAGPPG